MNEAIVIVIGILSNHPCADDLIIGPMSGKVSNQPAAIWQTAYPLNSYICW